MKTALKIGAMVAVMFLARAASAADDIAAGKVKGVDADKQQFVLTDAAGKEWTFKFGDKFVVNRGGQESQGALKPGDAILVHYDNGVINRSAKYILVQEGDSMHWTMAHGNFKGYDAGTKQFTFTDPNGKDFSYPMGDAAVKLNHEKSTINDIKIGDHVLAVMDATGNPASLKLLCAHRD
ncbi:MAG: hypothetical protein K8T91_13015 [Planctomycetes bacterium]|nr:hypothetical protein [Planctomycetota bacterium]